jgi:hypothetical protein
MSIFGRRILQRLINDNSRFMSERQTQRHVTLLNFNDARSAPAEWEIVLLNSLSRLGEVQYEPDLGGQSRPHLLVSRSGIEPFVAEITSVSDVGYEDANPVREFESTFLRLAKKKRLGLAGFHFQVGSESIGNYPEQKTRLLLPRKVEMQRFVARTYAEFLDDVRQQPTKAHSHEYRDARVQITVTYTPYHGGISGAGHASYVSLKAREANTLYKPLAKKADALKRCGSTRTRGIIVCDAGASFLSSESSRTAFGVRDIVAHCFRKHSTVSFVMMVCTITVPDTNSGRNRPRLSREVFLNGYLNRTPDTDTLIETLNASIDTAPHPARLALNAYRQIPASFRLFENSHYGGGSLSSNQINISARVVQVTRSAERSTRRSDENASAQVDSFIPLRS